MNSSIWTKTRSKERFFVSKFEKDFKKSAVQFNFVKWSVKGWFVSNFYGQLKHFVWNSDNSQESFRFPSSGKVQYHIRTNNALSIFANLFFRFSEFRHIKKLEFRLAKSRNASPFSHYVIWQSRHFKNFL